MGEKFQGIKKNEGNRKVFKLNHDLLKLLR